MKVAGRKGRFVIGSACLAAVLALAQIAAAETRIWDFRVSLGDREIGSHRFTLRKDGDASELRSEARFDVSILLFPAYSYEHEATERWSDGCLRSLVSRTDDDGERLAVDWRSPESGCLMSFAYWNPRILQAERLIDAQTGEIVPVRVTPLGQERVTVRGRPVSAQRHRIDAEKLTIDVWYAADEWVALESGTSGGVLRYALQ